MSTIRETIATLILNKIFTNYSLKIKAVDVKEILDAINAGTLYSDDELLHNDLDGLNEGNFKHLTATQLEQLVTIIGLMSGVASNVQTQLNNKVNQNTIITPGIGKTKVTYDAKGLILSADDATTADIDEDVESDRLYITQAEKDQIASSEDTSNKAEDFSVINHVLFPTVQATEERINALISALVDSSPSTLNTLNELAAALGDDPDFATTVSTLIGLRELLSNKTDTLATYSTSSTKYPSCKGVYDHLVFSWQPKLVSGSNLRTINGNSLLGSTDLILTAPCGIFGISDSTGSYTYYTTWALARAASTAGQTIELFTNVTEASSSYILKDGVNINGNGYTITFTNSGSGFIDNGVACIVRANDIEIKHTIAGQIAVYSTSGGTKIMGNAVINSSLAGAGGTGTYGFYGSGSLYGLTIKGNDCLAFNYAGLGAAYGCTIICTSGAVGSYGEWYNCTIISTSTGGVLTYLKHMQNCSVSTNGSVSFNRVQHGSTISNTTVKNFTNAIFTSDSSEKATALNCTFITLASAVGALDTFDNCTVIATTTGAGAAQFNSNCKFTTYLDGCLYGALGALVYEFNNCSFDCKWNSASAYIFSIDSYFGTSLSSIVRGCSFKLANSSAVAVKSYRSDAVNIKLAGISLLGSANLKGATVTNTQTNTVDSQGNILIN